VLDSAKDAYADGTGLGTGATRYGFLGDGSEASGYNGDRNGYEYGGLLDDVYVYHRVLSETEIADLAAGLALSDEAAALNAGETESAGLGETLSSIGVSDGGSGGGGGGCFISTAP
jgi:hypothetical protein